MMKDGRVHQDWLDTPERAEEDAVVLSGRGFDVYFGVLPRLEREGNGESISDQADVMWADWDGKAFSDKAGAFRALSKVAPEPQIVVDSGNGYHTYWLLDDLYPFDQVQEVMKGMHILAGADKTYDKARILRVPGTLNYKSDPPNHVRILRMNLLTRRHRLSDFVAYAEAGTAQHWQSHDASPVNVTGWEVSRDDAPKFGPGQRNNGLARLAGIMYARGMSQTDVEKALQAENWVRCRPPLEHLEVQAIVRSLARYQR